MTSSLVWSPVYSVLEDRVKAGDDIILVLVPFIKLDALKQLHWVHKSPRKWKIVCRWKPEDLVAGVSDLEIFDYLEEFGAQLYINPNIHLKLYVFESNVAFNTSGNLTLSGLGYQDKTNIEVGNMVKLSTQDWKRIFAIIEGSRQVDHALYSKLQDWLKEQKPSRNPIESFPDLFTEPKRFTISTLPATETPAKLLDFYFDTHTNFEPEVIRRAMHDLVTFKIPPDLEKKDFQPALRSAFIETPFVIDFVKYLSEAKSLSFGAVTAWIHQKCEDVPLPYRWEIKENTAIFYDWLAFFFSNITWDRPRHSQIIRWKDHES
jgi:hypothetical protein